MPPSVSMDRFIAHIIKATSDLVCAYKINFAFFEAMGKTGFDHLKTARECVPAEIPVIADAKRADIGNTSAAYARAIFDVLGFDAVTVNPYMGHDSILPFINYAERGVFILCKTSNPGAGDFQSLPLQSEQGPAPLYQIIAHKALQWNKHGNIGLVVGATCPDELKLIRSKCPDLQILIPGVGAQVGNLESAVINGIDFSGQLAIINSSRQIIHASDGTDFARKSRAIALEMRNKINSIRQNCLPC